MRARGFCGESRREEHAQLKLSEETPLYFLNFPGAASSHVCRTLKFSPA